MKMFNQNTLFQNVNELFINESSKKLVWMTEWVGKCQSELYRSLTSNNVSTKKMSSMYELN